MLERHAVPLIHGMAIEPVLELLNEVGAPTSDLLVCANVPTSPLKAPTGLVSARSMLRFMALSSDCVGFHDLGWRVATGSQVSQLGRWGGPVSSRGTLREAIETFCHLYSQEISFVELGLSFENDYVWLWRRRDLPPKDPIGEIQGEQFMLGVMTQIIRLVAGSQWAPPAIRLDSRSPRWLRKISDLQGSRLDLGFPSMAIAIPYHLMDRRLPSCRASRTLGNKDSTPDIPHGFLESLRISVTQLRSQSVLPIELGAEIAGVSPRTLRRWLRDEETSWRELVDGVRLDYAERVLKMPSPTIADISHEVGYSDPAHFTRAFHRWTGETPRDYRRRKSIKT